MKLYLHKTLSLKVFLKTVIGTRVYVVREITLSGSGAGPQATHKRPWPRHSHTPEKCKELP